MILIHKAGYFRRLFQDLVNFVFELSLSDTMNHDQVMLMMTDSQFQVTLEGIELYSQDGNVAQPFPVFFECLDVQIYFLFGLQRSFGLQLYFT